MEEVSSERQNTKEHIKTNVDQFLHSDNHQNSFNVINQDCSIKSPYTKTEVNLHSFNIVSKSVFVNFSLNKLHKTIKFQNYFKEHCPTSTKFNKTFEYVRLLYSTNAFCPPEPTRSNTTTSICWFFSLLRFQICHMRCFFSVLLVKRHL